jgi:hypothetical protein
MHYKHGRNFAMTSLARKWEARLAAEGMPREPVRARSQIQYVDLAAARDTATVAYWTGLTHVVHSLNGAFSDIDKQILKAYVESGYLIRAAKETGVTKRRARTALARLHRWIKDKQEPRRKEKAR